MEKQYMVNIKDIHNVIVGDDNMKEHLTRVSPNAFQSSWTGEGICSACHERLDNGEDHSECECRVLNETETIEEINEMLESGSDMRAIFNSGFPDEVVIALNNGSV